MTKSEIEAFLAVVKFGSISKAAEKLYITQPALSRRISALEDELGYMLIIRGRGIRNIELTESGKDFIELALKWIALHSEMQDLDAEKNKETFRISSVDSVDSYLLAPFYQKFIIRNPQVLLDIRDFESYTAYNEMETNLLDLAFVIDQRFSKKVLTQPAFTEPMQLICPQDYHLPDRIHPSELVPEHEIFILWHNEWEKWHRIWFPNTSRPLIKITKLTNLEHFIQNRKSWCIVPSSVATALIKKLPVKTCQLTETPPKRVISYLSVPGQKQEFFDDFLGCLREYIENIPSSGIEVLF